MEESLVALLLATSGITSLVSTRIYWTLKPQKAANPYIVLTRVSGVRDYTYQEPSRLVASRVQVDCYSLTFLEAKSIARAVEARLSGVKLTQGSTIFEGGFVEGERDTFEDAPTPDKLFRTSLDFIIWHKGA